VIYSTTLGTQASIPSHGCEMIYRNKAFRSRRHRQQPTIRSLHLQENLEWQAFEYWCL